ncbi:hypothetical protein PR001_g722 [Phytophthora rubi]|uniref:Uncharacterized protein n=1 Tax=Phytophthora rubi TaxID=129364 RepID=A0A6A3P9B7_9STRA|nr:hypothetical protein PR001_g722 [Phytophthora rubi]
MRPPHNWHWASVGMCGLISWPTPMSPVSASLSSLQKKSVKSDTRQPLPVHLHP